MELITIRIPEKLLYALDRLVEAGEFASRSEVIRVAIRDFLKKYQALVSDVEEFLRKANKKNPQIERIEDKGEEA